MDWIESIHDKYNKVRESLFYSSFTPNQIAFQLVELSMEEAEELRNVNNIGTLTMLANIRKEQSVLQNTPPESEPPENSFVNSIRSKKCQNEACEYQTEMRWF